MLQTHMDAERFIDLYEETLDDVYRYASRLAGGDRVRTDELVQETYLGVLRRLRAGEVEEVTTSYLIVACRNRFLDQLRRERRRRRREERSIAIDGRADALDPTDRDDRRALAALGEIGKDQRAALVLRYVDDLTVADVADRLGRSVRATESLLVRARAPFRIAYHEGTDS